MGCKSALMHAAKDLDEHTSHLLGRHAACKAGSRASGAQQAESGQVRGPASARGRRMRSRRMILSNLPGSASRGQQHLSRATQQARLSLLSQTQPHLPVHPLGLRVAAAHGLVVLLLWHLKCGCMAVDRAASGCSAAKQPGHTTSHIGMPLPHLAVLVQLPHGSTRPRQQPLRI